MFTFRCFAAKCVFAEDRTELFHFIYRVFAYFGVIYALFVSNVFFDCKNSSESLKRISYLDISKTKEKFWHKCTSSNFTYIQNIDVLECVLNVLNIQYKRQGAVTLIRVYVWMSILVLYMKMCLRFGVICRIDQYFIGDILIMKYNVEKISKTKHYMSSR